MTDSERPRVVIVGAGFGGLWAAKALRRAAVDVELIDRHNYHTFFPLLYQVAAAELAPGDITHPVRKIIRKQDNVRFTMARVTGLDPDERKLATTAGVKDFDYLILAVGSTTSYFGVEGAAEHSFGLRTLEDAVSLRDHILQRFERAEQLPAAERDAETTFVIVGGGPTGVEFAGALQELINGPLDRDHPRLDLRRAKVMLIEATDRLLRVYPDRLSAYAMKRLEKMGVDVRLETAVERVSPHGVTLAGGGRIPAETTVWTAGVGGPDYLREWGFETSKSGRVEVRPDLTVSSAPHIFVVGDSSDPPSAEAPMVAQNATQQGTLAAKNVIRSIAGEPLEDYTYRDLGNMAVIGRNAAVVDLFGRIAFKGYFAWLLWLALHLAKLIGFRNRVAALLSWSGDYLFRDRVARLISEPEFPEPPVVADAVETNGETDGDAEKDTTNDSAHTAEA